MNNSLRGRNSLRDSLVIHLLDQSDWPIQTVMVQVCCDPVDLKIFCAVVVTEKIQRYCALV